VEAGRELLRARSPRTYQRGSRIRPGHERQPSWGRGGGPPARRRHERGEERARGTRGRVAGPGAWFPAPAAPPAVKGGENAR
jgi:hypothetical protein